MDPLAIVGNVNVDMIMGPVAPWPMPGSEVVVEHDELRIGGSAANSALTLAALGADFQVAASTGEDLHGKWMREGLQPYSRSWPVARAASCVSVGITHPNGERTFFTTRGHLGQLSWLQVETMIDWPRLGGGWLLLCGGFLTDGLARDYDRLFDTAKRHRIRVALDTGWPPDGWSAENLSRAGHWVSRSDCVLVNDVEAASLTGGAGGDQAVLALREMMGAGGIAIVKRGPDGACLSGGEAGLLHARAPQIATVDTIGAGDVFNAAFLFSLCKGERLQEALDFGVATASLAVSTFPRRYVLQG